MTKKPEFFQQRSEVVYSVEDSIVSISSSDVDFLREVAENSSLRKARVLLHGSPDNDLHEMLISHSFGQYIQPHINNHSAKSFVVLDGEMVVVLFNNEGAISKHIELAAFSGATPFLLRLENPVFHTVVPISATVIFLETVKGPHTETNYAPFSPSPNDTSESEKYITWLMEELAIKQ
jgi:cupin fold WbuC family metalloprotein